MFNEKIINAFNKQLNEELFSSYLYLYMSSYFQENNLKGFAHWMKIQTQEENLHAMKFYDFILERNGKIKLTDIKASTLLLKSPLNAFEEAYKHEAQVTKKINQLVQLVNENNDFASQPFLQWFLQEQIEEEAQTLDILNKLKLIKDNTSALFMLDNELGARIFKQIK